MRTCRTTKNIKSLSTNISYKVLFSFKSLFAVFFLQFCVTAILAITSGLTSCHKAGLVRKLDIVLPYSNSFLSRLNDCCNVALDKIPSELSRTPRQQRCIRKLTNWTFAEMKYLIASSVKAEAIILIIKINNNLKG